MTSFLIFVIAVILIAIFWRLFAFLTLAAVVIVGIVFVVILATMTETFGPFKPSADQLKWGCKSPTQTECVSAGYPINGGRPPTPAEKATQDKQWEEIKEAQRKKDEAAAQVATQQRELAEHQRKEAEQQAQVNALWAAFLQTPGGAYHQALLQRASQQATMARISTYSGIDLQAAIQQEYQANANLQALWKHYLEASFPRDGLCFTNAATSESHVCHPEWGSMQPDTVVQPGSGGGYQGCYRNAYSQYQNHRTAGMMTVGSADNWAELMCSGLK